MGRSPDRPPSCESSPHPLSQAHKDTNGVSVSGRSENSAAPWWDSRFLTPTSATAAVKASLVTCDSSDCGWCQPQQGSDATEPAWAYRRDSEGRSCLRVPSISAHLSSSSLSTMSHVLQQQEWQDSWEHDCSNDRDGTMHADCIKRKRCATDARSAASRRHKAAAGCQDVQVVPQVSASTLHSKHASKALQRCHYSSNALDKSSEGASEALCSVGELTALDRSVSGSDSGEELPEPLSQDTQLKNNGAAAPAAAHPQNAAAQKQKIVLKFSWDGFSELGAGQPAPPSVRLHEVAVAEAPGSGRTQGSRCSRQPQSDIVCGIDFSDDGSLLARVGIAKQVRVYSVADMLASESAAAGPTMTHRMPSKLSSVAWDPHTPGLLTVGDYDGVVSQLYVSSGHFLVEADQHYGRRVWSVAHSKLRPHLCASASDDGTVRLWGGFGLDSHVATLAPAPGWSICGVDFCEGDANLLALSCGDTNAYIYDLRNSSEPLHKLAGHTRPVSFARFLAPNAVITSSTDATLALWDLTASSTSSAVPTYPRGPPSRVATYQGHPNSRNFVGLAVRYGEGLIACGSESRSVYAYHASCQAPLTKYELVPAAGFEACSGAGEFVSAVKWQPQGGCRGGAPLLAAALSDGDLRLLALEGSQ